MNTSESTAAMVDPSTLPTEVPDPITATEAGRMVEAGTLSSISNQSLTLIIFAFGLIALALFYFMLRSGRATPFLMRMYVIIILVFGTLLVVSSAYSEQQIAPVVGFFGTIAGYLLGRSDRPDPMPGSASDSDQRPIGGS